MSRPLSVSGADGAGFGALRVGSALAAAALLLLVGCGNSDAPGDAGAEPPATTLAAGNAAAFAEEIAAIDRRVEGVDSIFQPLPLLRPTQETELRRFGSDDQLRVARSLGVSGELNTGRIAELQRQGSLVRIEDDAGLIVRRLDHSQPLVVPALRELLTEISARFQARVQTLGAPAYRLEVTSGLRTAEDQESLRAVNPNAATGESTHELGTSVDLAYNGFAAPLDQNMDASGEEALRRLLHRYEAVALERVAGRRSAELKAILGEVLLELQREGRVMVTLERLQPVFHITVSG